VSVDDRVVRQSCGCSGQRCAGHDFGTSPTRRTEGRPVSRASSIRAPQWTHFGSGQSLARQDHWGGNGDPRKGSRGNRNRDKDKGGGGFGDPPESEQDCPPVDPNADQRCVEECVQKYGRICTGWAVFESDPDTACTVFRDCHCDCEFGVHLGSSAW
jgi:hypothetical protein